MVFQAPFVVYTSSLCYGQSGSKGQWLPRLAALGSPVGVHCTVLHRRALPLPLGEQLKRTVGLSNGYLGPWNELLVSPRQHICQSMPGHGVTLVQDGLTQGGSALRKLPQLLLWDLPEIGWLLVLGRAQPWHGHSMARSLRPRVPLVHPRARLVAGTWKWQFFTGVQLCPGSMAAGTWPEGQGLGHCTGWGSSLCFSKLFITPQRPGYLQHICHTEGHKQKLQTEAPLTWTSHARPLPQHAEAQLRVGALSRLWTRGGEALWDNKPQVPGLLVLSREHLSAFGAILQPSLGSPPVNAEQGEPPPLEIPRMSWANHWADIHPQGDLLSWTWVILISRDLNPRAKYCMTHVSTFWGGGNKEPQTASTSFKVSASARLIVQASPLGQAGHWGGKSAWKTHNIKQRVDLQWGRWDQGHQQRRRHTETRGRQSKASNGSNIDFTFCANSWGRLRAPTLPEWMGCTPACSWVSTSASEGCRAPPQWQ